MNGISRNGKDEGTPLSVVKASEAIALEARLKALEHGQATIIEHLHIIRTAARTAGSAGAAPNLASALARIEELEIQLEDALAPPEPLPIGLDLKMSPVRCKIYALLKRKALLNPEGFVHKDAIISALYGLSDEIPSTKALHVHIFHLRKRLPDHEQIESVWGQGWRLVTKRLDVTSRLSLSESEPQPAS